jgi:hypothetical protein
MHCKMPNKPYLNECHSLLNQNKWFNDLCRSKKESYKEALSQLNQERSYENKQFLYSRKKKIINTAVKWPNKNS